MTQNPVMLRDGFHDWVGGTVFGLAGPGLRWQHRSDRPSWHPDDCNGSCCWRTVDDDRE